MKRIRSYLIALSVLLALVVGCGNDDDDDNGGSTDDDTETATDDDTGPGEDTETESATGQVDPDTSFTEMDAAEVNKLAVVIGVSDYIGSDNDLQKPHMDTRFWYEYLHERGYQIKILGDGRPEMYLTYHDNATKSNIHKYIKYMMEFGDSNDMLAITFAGHGAGDGNGNSYYFTWDGQSYWDSEMASALQQSSGVGQLFIFLAACFSGGFGPELMSGPDAARTWAATNATEDGFGYESPSLPSLAWTYYFLNYSLMLEHEGQVISMEENFAFAEPLYTENYAQSPGDIPQEFDGNSSQPFYLSEDGTHWFQNAEATPAHSGDTLGHRLGGYQRIEVSETNWSLGPESRHESSHAIFDSAKIQEVFHLLNPNQPLDDRAATCLFSHVFTFVDDDGKVKGKIGICDAPAARANHEAVFVSVDADGNMVSREGLRIPYAERLFESLKPSC